MPQTWRWIKGTPASWGSMTDTDHFTDGLPGDTSTYEQVAEANLFYTRPVREGQTAEVLLWAQGYLGNSQVLTGLDFSCWTARTWYPVNPECAAGEEEPPAPTENATYAVSVWDGAAFTEVSAGTLNVAQQPSSAEFFVKSVTFPAVTTCWVILTVFYAVGVVSCEGEIIAGVGISDIRTQGSDTGIACAEGEDGGDGPMDDPLDPGGDEPGNASGAVTASRNCSISAFVPPARNCSISAFVPPARSCAIFAGGVPGKGEIFTAPPASTYAIDGDGAYARDSDGRYAIDQ